MRIFINDDPREVPDGFTIADLVEHEHAAGGGRGVAVAVDANVVPRGEWDETELAEDQHVELVAAIQGGSE